MSGTVQNPLASAGVADAVAEVKSLDPGLGSYNFKGLSEVVKFGEVMSHAGAMLPQHLQNQPALCMAVTMRATHWGFDPFALAMETYQAKPGGPIGYQAKVFTAALLNAGVKLRYRYEGEITILDKPVKSHKGNQVAARTATGTRKCIAYAEVNGDILEFETLTLDQITIKNSPLWHNDPDSQLAYSAGRGWARRYRSDVIMGAYSADEVEEMAPIRDVTPKETGFAAMTTRARKEAQSQTVEDAQPDVDESQPIDGEILPEEDKPGHWTDGIDTINAFPGDEMFTEGARAFQKGDPRTDCPNDVDGSSCHWLGGWDEAARAAEGDQG